MRARPTSLPLRAHLCSLELALHQADVRGDATALGRLLHPAFVEVGRSGRRYDLQQMLTHLLSDEPNGPSAARIHAQDFELQILTPDLALLLYRSAHIDTQKQAHGHSRRSSLWQQVGSAWQLRFHQGTACDPFELNFLV